VFVGSGTVAGRDPQRIAARIVLVVLATLLIATMAGPAMRAFAAGPTIELINPSKGSSLNMSDKNDGTDTKYHVVAAVSTVPASPAVEFELEDADGTRTTYPADRVGLTDTWEAFIDLPSTFAAYTLRASLFSGQSEVDRDQEAVSVDNDPEDPPFNQGETAEITYPTNGGQWGVYTAPNGSTNGIIEATLSTSAQPELATRFVRGMYTVTPTGTEPVWKDCTGNKSITAGTTSVRLRCNLANADINTPVTAVSVVVNDTPQGPSAYNAAFDETSDGHRVFSYKQAATSVTIDNPSTTVPASSNVYPCKKLVATVLDQNERQIAGINVDVHATGPTDNLRFHTTGAFADASKAPDQGSHGTESAYNCTANATAGTQGEHNIIAQNDRKHIESVNGTNDLGQYSFALKDEDAPGGTGETQITAWADSDGDDEYCSQEASGDAAIGWGVPAPTPTGESSETGTCPVPTPTPTPPGRPTDTPSQCDDGNDNDHDGNIDGQDRGCNADDTEAGEVKRFNSSFGKFFFDKEDKGFRGRVDSSKNRCKRNRTVVLRRAQRGDDPKVAVDPRTGRYGSFFIKQGKAHGTYYTIVKRKEFFAKGSRNICLSAKSKLVRVNR
jgi:hypothetical protein